MNPVLDAPSPASGPTVGDRVRFVLRGVGQTLITAGLVVLLFVVYEVWVTNYFAHEQQSQVKHALATQWKNGTDPLLPLPDGSLPSLPTGTGIADLFIPRLGRDYAWTIVQGVTDADLEKGPGHYAESALPGQVGNFAIAGHRVGKGEPFLNLDLVRAGDAVVVETESHWYVYRVKGAPGNLAALGADGIPGRQIVDPDDGNVLLAVPNHPGQTATEALMTMTTCHPKFTAAHRMIVFAQLQQTVARKGATMPAQITALYKGVTG